MVIIVDITITGSAENITIDYFVASQISVNYDIFFILVRNKWLEFLNLTFLIFKEICLEDK